MGIPFPSTLRPTAAILTCRACDLPHFCGFDQINYRGFLVDLHFPVDDRATLRTNFQVARSRAVHFYGYTPTGRLLTPAVFACSKCRYFEAPCSSSLQPIAQVSPLDACPSGADLTLARAYYRCLAETLAALSDPAPWLPHLSPEAAQAIEDQDQSAGQLARAPGAFA